MKKITSILLLFLSINSYAQNSTLEFRENKGQWNKNVLFKAHIPGGNLYLESNRLTYQFYNEIDVLRMGDLHHGFIKNPTHQDSVINLHAFQVNFINALVPDLNPQKPRPDYENYFVNKDKNKWASHVKKFETVQYQELYKGIDLKFYLKESYLKYDFIVTSEGNPHEIKMQYDGIDESYLKNGNLYIKTSVNEIVEQKPYAYQVINGVEKEVKCKFALKENVLSFIFPKGYKKKYPLIIDPVLVFASYSGSTIDNWGYTSTFNQAGNLYGGGVSFGVGYPFTTGAYQTTFGGGTTDISITKFSPDGSSLIYSTYLGGTDSDNPHSLIVNSNDELLILGTTNSPDFPSTVGAYDNTQNGNYDIFVAKLSTDGSTLLASTFVGGSGSDGLNTSTQLNYNYADEFRGELIVDANDYVYVASSTSSSNFPTTAGAFQTANNGGEDGCVFKLSPALNNLVFSSYIGGSSSDAAYSVQLGSNGNIYATGGTTSNNFPTTGGVLNPSSLGGVDGWLAKISSNGNSIIASTYLGTSDYDQCYFVQLDTGNNVYVVGQTSGAYNITPASVYNVPNSGQFLHKLNNSLSATIFSTTFGTGSGEVDIALSAFLVNDCNYIFVSGWGGQVNSGNSLATSSTTNGLVTTANAIQTTTDGSDYYLALFDEDATSLKFATFFGGNASADHVDGGTSRFDKRGIVYQSVCSSCGFATTDFPTTPGAWSNTNNSPNCNLGVFKIDLTVLTANVDIYTTPYHCVGDTVHFQNLSNGGISYFWDFDDGNTSTLFEPVHAYSTPGNYTVMLVSVDSASCLKTDTDYVEVFINLPPVAAIDPVNPICKGDSLQLNVVGGLVYDWQPNYNIINSNTATPTVFPDTATIYTVIISDSCGTDTAQILINIHPKNISISPDTMICLGENVTLNAIGGGTYLWGTNATLSNINIANPVATPNTNTTYSVSITDLNGCVWDTTVTVSLDTLMPVALASADVSICPGDTIEIYAEGGHSYSWSPTSTIINPTDSLIKVFPSQSTNYVVEVANGCGVDYDTVLVHVQSLYSSMISDTNVCAGDYANLWAVGGTSYLWQPTGETTSNIHPMVYEPTTFSVEITDAIGCTSSSLTVFVDVLPKPTVEIGANIETAWGTQVQLNPTTNGISYSWSPSEGLSCLTCLNPTVKADETSTYILTVLGVNGCYNSDTITIYYDGSIYVPNSFTPDGNGENDIFYAYGKDIVKLEFNIFDRWGERIFFTDDITKGWDGTYKGKTLPNGVYIWKIWYQDVLGISGNLIGKVTLVK